MKTIFLFQKGNTSRALGAQPIGAMEMGSEFKVQVCVPAGNLSMVISATEATKVNLEPRGSSKQTGLLASLQMKNYSASPENYFP